VAWCFSTMDGTKGSRRSLLLSLEPNNP
jgi:hypothetical protein